MFPMSAVSFDVSAVTSKQMYTYIALVPTKPEKFASRNVPAPASKYSESEQFPSTVGVTDRGWATAGTSGPPPWRGARRGAPLVPPPWVPRKLYTPVSSERSRQSVASIAIAIVPVVTPVRSRLASIRVRSFATSTVREDAIQVDPDHSNQRLDRTWP